MDDQDTLTFRFPIEVIVVGQLSDDDRKTIHEGIWTDLHDALNYTEV
jgi:hypothetical protein